MALLGETLRSIVNQTDKHFLVLIAGHDRPELPELNDPRISFHPVSFPIPKDGFEGKQDQTRKTHFLGAVAKEHGGGYLMFVDSDDLVHKDIVRFVRSDDNRAGYMIRAGYVLDAVNGRLGKFSGNPPRQFFNHCGTSSIIYFVPDDLPDRSTDKTGLRPGNSFMESVSGHGSWEAKLLERDIYPATLPFRGSVYRLNTGDNASYTYRRDDKTIQRLISYTIKFPVSFDVLKSDFGFDLPSDQTGEEKDVSARDSRQDIGAKSQSGVSIRPTQEGEAAKTLETNSRGKEPKTIYGGKFYSERRVRTLYSARRVLEIVMGRFSVESVIDVGCGTGTWLDVARTLGAVDVKGLEGLWLDLNQRDSDDIEIVKTDLEDTISDDRKYDLAICLEVAEHLSEPRAGYLVDDLCRLSDLVLFGAAIPGQGGRGHVNEQWQSYWTAHFGRHGYVPVDLVRPEIWSDKRIRFWYKQNTLLYCNAKVHDVSGVIANMPALDVVHPGLFERKLRKYEEQLKELQRGARDKAVAPAAARHR